MDAENYIEMLSVENDHWWYCGRRAILISLIQQNIRTTIDSIVELGSGTGGNLKMLSRFGRVKGLEPNEFAREASIKQGFDVVDGSLPLTPFEKEEADLVVMFDVLEHLDDDYACLKSAASLVKSGGYLFVTVPAYNWLWSHHDVTNHHKRRYTATQLRALAQKTGLTVERCTYFNALLFPLVVLIRSYKRILKLRTQDASMPSSKINSVLKNIFRFERNILRRRNIPFGLSIGIILKKQA